MTTRVNFTMTLPEDTKKKLDKFSEQSGVPRGVVLQRLAEEFLAGRIKTNALPTVKP